MAKVGIFIMLMMAVLFFIQIPRLQHVSEEITLSADGITSDLISPKDISNEKAMYTYITANIIYWEEHIWNLINKPDELNSTITILAGINKAFNEITYPECLSPIEKTLKNHSNETIKKLSIKQSDDFNKAIHQSIREKIEIKPLLMDAIVSCQLKVTSLL